MAVTPQQIPRMMHGAMQTALARGGVGVVGVPADVITEPTAEDTASTLPAYTTREPEPSQSDVHAAAEMIDNAQSVAIFAGSGAAATPHL